MEKMNNLNEFVNSLSSELAYNYFSVSFAKDDRSQEFKNVFVDPGHFEGLKRSRNILLIGGGASLNSCPFMKFGKDLMKDLYQHFCEGKPDEWKKNNLIAKETAFFKPNQVGAIKEFDRSSDTEKFLSLLSKELGYSESEELRAQLQKHYELRYYPTLLYEIVAHLFKHSFIDVIINFNFDEMLDQALDDEVGNTHYKQVMMDGDCPIDFDEIMEKGRLKLPVYIKIHGTASSKSSLKFTDDDHNIKLSPEIKSFIGKLLSGQRSSDSQGVDDSPVLSTPVKANIISLGFDFARFRFHEMINSNCLPESNIYVLNFNKKEKYIDYLFSLEEEPQKPLFNTIVLNLEDFKDSKKDLLLDNDKYYLLENHEPPMALVFLSIWEKIQSYFRDPFQPRGMARHIITTLLFYDRKLTESNSTTEVKQKYHSKNYFYDRCLLEMSFSLLRNKGVVEPQEMLKDRFGEYFYLLTHKENITARTTISDIFNAFGLISEFSYVNNLLNVDLTIKRDEHRSLIEFIQDYFDRDRQKAIKPRGNDYQIERDQLPLLVLYRLYKSLKSTTFKQNMKDSGVMNMILSMMDKIYSGFIYDIRPKYTDRGMMLFNSFMTSSILHTNLSLTYQFYNMFMNPDQWDTLLLVSERGKFLRTHLNSLATYIPDNTPEKIKETREKILNKRIIVVCSFESIMHQYDSKILNDISKEFSDFGDFKKLTVLALPFWEHHHHMSLFLKYSKNTNRDELLNYLPDGNNIEFVNTVYYFKQGFSFKINPISLPTNNIDPANGLQRVKMDYSLVLKYFYDYFIKGLSFLTNQRYVPILESNLSFNLNKIFNENEKGKNIIKRSNLEFIDLKENYSIHDFLADLSREIEGGPPALIPDTTTTTTYEGEIKIFISYSHHDEKHKDEFMKFFLPFQRNNNLDFFVDHMINPGARWDNEIKKELEASNIIIFLVSQNSLNSDYINDKELPVALAKEKVHESIIIPIILTDCTWEETIYKEFQFLSPLQITDDSTPGYAKAWKRVMNHLSQIILDLHFEKVDGALKIFIKKKKK